MRRDPRLLLSLAIVAAIVVASISALLDARGVLLRWEDTHRPPPTPLAVEFVSLRALTGPPLTITQAPGRQLLVTPALAGLGERPLLKGAPAVDPDLAGKLRAVARLAPPSSSAADGERLMTFDAVEPAVRTGRVILLNGCLRLAGGNEPLVILPAGTRLVRESGGHVLMIVIQNVATNARVGEEAVWGEMGRRRIPTTAADRLRRSCGTGGIVLLGLAQSVSGLRAQSDALAARNFNERYGLGWSESLRRVVRCRERSPEPMGSGNLCGSTPPPPVADQAKCPIGTRLSGGLCRNPEGFVRPVPDV